MAVLDLGEVVIVGQRVAWVHLEKRELGYLPVYSFYTDRDKPIRIAATDRAEAEKVEKFIAEL